MAFVILDVISPGSGLRADWSPSYLRASWVDCALLTCSNYLPKTHTIEKLQHFCIQINPAFNRVFRLDSKFHRRSFRRLQRAYVEARYSEHYEITEEELTYLASEVTKLKALVEKTCHARLIDC